MHDSNTLETMGTLDSLKGRTRAYALMDHPEQRYLLYCPQNLHADTPMVVAVHGISRNGREQIEQFQDLAERYQAILLAPLFTKPHFKDYQRLGRVGRGERADLALAQMIHEATQITDTRLQPVYLFGYSGGGQFAHRFAMAWPQHVARLAIGAAGWYTWPDLSRKYPYGVRETDALPGVVFDPAAFLNIPTLVMVGEWDAERDPGLNRAPHIDRRQGTTRIERGKRWVAAMKDAAAAYGYDTEYRFELLPSSGHSFLENMARGNMGERVFEFFFGHKEEQ
ncbi:MAG TPA: hypothetical protein ENJ22_05475 [Gammaproteobacteria bacterium]|nr:hypothetical protein [Gammaproteobacteria bacterium]